MAEKLQCPTCPMAMVDVSGLSRFCNITRELYYLDHGHHCRAVHWRKDALVLIELRDRINATLEEDKS